MSLLVEQLVQRLTSTRTSSFVPPVDGQRRAAVAAVLHDEPSGPRVLLMKRAERAGDPWSGHISLPGGGYQAEDADLLVTAMRETQEELGLQLTPDHFVGSLAPLAPRTSGPTLIEVTPFVFRTRVAITPVCGPEALAAFWLPLELASTGVLDSQYSYTRGDSSMTFPSWAYEGHVIWGLTRRILDDLLALSR